MKNVVELQDAQTQVLIGELGFDPFKDYDVGRFAGRAEPAVEWLVQDLIPRKAVTAFAAVEGGSKTTMLMDLMHSIASSNPAHKTWLGAEVLQMGSVMMVTEEGENAGHLRLYDMGVDFESVRGRMCIIPYPALDRTKVKHAHFFGQDGEPTDHLIKLLALARLRKCRLMIIDPTTYFYRLDLDKDATAAYNAYGWLSSYAEQNDMAFITALHTNKAEKPGADPRSIIRGSQAIQGACRVVMYGRFAYQEERNEISKIVGRKVTERECIRVQVVKENVKGTSLEPRFLMKPKAGAPKLVDLSLVKKARLHDFEDTLEALVTLIATEAEKGKPVSTTGRIHSILTAIPSYLKDYPILARVQAAKSERNKPRPFAVDNLVNTLIKADRVVRIIRPAAGLTVPDGPFSEYAIGPKKAT